jgi:hypothetical protein
MPSKTSRILKELCFSAVLAVVTMAILGLIDRLRFSATRDRVSDALRWPAGLVTGLFYPQGIHTGYGSSGAIYLGIASFIGFYWLAWFFLLDVVGKIARAAKKQF